MLRFLNWLVVSLASLTTTATFADAQDPRLLATLEGHKRSVFSLAFSPDGKTLASGCLGESVRLWDVAGGRPKKTFGELYTCRPTFSPDGEILAVGSESNRIDVFDLENGKKRTLLDEFSQYAKPMVVFSPDGKRIATGGMCLRNILLLDVAKGKKLVYLEGDDLYGFEAIAFLPDGKSLASVGHDGSLRIWETTNGQNTSTFRIADEVFAAAFSSGVRAVAVATEKENSDTGSNKHLILLHDVASGRMRKSLEGHSKIVRAIAFSRDSKTFASGDESGIAKIWETATGKELASWQAHRNAVTTLAFSPNSRILASGGGVVDSESEEFSIKLWDVVDSSMKK